MRIICPQCAFERHIPEDRLPSAAVIATCPHCQHRFRIARPNQADHAGQATESAQAEEYTTEHKQQAEHEQHKQGAAPMPAHSAPHTAEEDDPLPPGAVIPGDAVPTPPAKASTSNDAPRNTTHETGKRGVTNKTGETGEKGEKGESPRTGDVDENDPEYRRAAAAAYEKQAEEGDQSFALDNPWEYPQRDGYAAAFYQTCMRVMFTAPRFFAGLQPDTPQRPPLFFFLLVCVIQILVERFWGGVFNAYFASTASSDPQLQQLLGMLAPQSNILLSLLMNTALKTLELFIASGLFFLIFKLLAPDNASYPLIFQVMAYSVAPAILCVVPVAGSVAGFIWSLACTLVGCRYALRLTWTQTILGIIPMYGIGILVLLHLMSSLQQVMA